MCCFCLLDTFFGSWAICAKELLETALKPCQEAGSVNQLPLGAFNREPFNKFWVEAYCMNMISMVLDVSIGPSRD